jgi:hypothetical protein
VKRKRKSVCAIEPKFHVEASLVKLNTIARPCESSQKLKRFELGNRRKRRPTRCEFRAYGPVSGSRGVICTEALDVDEISKNPLLLVPEYLYMTSQVARMGFEFYEEQGAPPLGELDQATQLAVLLAHERAQGKNKTNDAARKSKRLGVRNLVFILCTTHICSYLYTKVVCLCRGLLCKLFISSIGR